MTATKLYSMLQYSRDLRTTGGARWAVRFAKTHGLWVAEVAQLLVNITTQPMSWNAVEEEAAVAGFRRKFRRAWSDRREQASL